MKTLKNILVSLLLMVNSNLYGNSSGEIPNNDCVIQKLSNINFFIVFSLFPAYNYIKFIKDRYMFNSLALMVLIGFNEDYEH